MVESDRGRVRHDHIVSIEVHVRRIIFDGLLVTLAEQAMSTTSSGG